MKVYIKLIAILFFNLCLSQTSTLSEYDIRSLLEKEQSDSTRVKLLLELSDLLDEQNIIEPKKLSLEALNILNRMPKDSFSLKNKALVYDKLGVIERKASNYNQSLEYYFKALKIKEATQDSANLGRSFHNIGMVFRFQKEYEKSKEYFSKAIKLRKKLNDNKKLATTFNMYGIILAKQGKKDSALYYYRQAKKMYTNDLDIASVNSNVAVMHSREKEYDLAIKIYLENIIIFKKNKANYKLCKALISLSQIYRKTNQSKIAFNLNEDAEKIALLNGYKEHLKSIYLQQYKIYRDNNQYKNALENYRLFRKYKDSIYNIDRAKEIAVQEINYQHEKEKIADSLQFVIEKKEIKLIADAAKNKNQFYFALLLLASAIIISVILLMKRQKNINNERLEKELLEKELLDERLKNVQFQNQKVIADKTMRLEFTKEFLVRIKNILKRSSEKPNPELQMLISELQSQTKVEKKLEILEDNYANTNLDFEKQLLDNFPVLSKSEREICSLIKLNLSLKEIMTIRNSSMASIKSARYRIRKKLNVPKDIELEIFIQKLFSN